MTNGSFARYRQAHVGMIVTIDGPAGAGKSSAARGLAQRLGWEFLDTGAMFRAVALAGIRRAIDFSDHAAIEKLLPALRLDQIDGRNLLNGEDVSQAIRTPEVTAASSRVAVIVAVRADLAIAQRRIAQGRRMVCEGRDQGTVVFPEAFCKFYLDASPEVRAARRHAERLARGESISFEQVLLEQQERDSRDASRQLAPLRPADDAIYIDTSQANSEQVLDRLEREVRQRWCGL